MSKLISQLLQAKEPLFSHSVDQLEKASGRHGQDVKLTAEIIEKYHDKTRQLGLDSKDVTAPELYQALLNRIKEHDLHLAQAIGGKDPEDVLAMMPLIEKVARATKMPDDCWVLKTSVAKEMLRQMPPPNIMKRLGYRSIEALLKKEKLPEIYGALRFAEGGDWLNQFNALYSQLKPSDFENRKIQLVRMPERWSDLAAPFMKKKLHNITHLKELGVVLMLPPTIKRMPGITLKDLPLIFHYFNEIRLYSAFFKLQQVKPNFGEIFVNTLLAEPSKAAVMGGQHVHWRVIQRYFGRLKDEYHPEIFEPHVQPEDLHWRTAEDLLYDIDPELEFWQGLDYVGQLFDGEAVTFNLMDVSFSYSNQTPFADRPLYHFRESLWNELFMRYMGEATLRDQILKQLDNDLIAPENLSKG